MLKVLAFLMLWGNAPAADRISLQKKLSALQKTEVIASLYKDSGELAKEPAGKELGAVLKANGPLLEGLAKDFQESSSFVRGEIEDEKTLGQLMTALQLSMLRARSFSFQSKWPEVQKEFANWFLFAADFPYEESSLVGLRTSGVIRSLLLDDLEKIQKKFSSEMAKDPGLRKWFLQVRAPWPVDRILVSEAKRLLKPPMMSVAEAAARAFQKNPYQTSEKALEKVKGGQSEAAQLLKQIWREQDIQLMKTEINRIGQLKIRFAQAEFELKNKKTAQSVQELVDAQFLDQVPIDYFTGKPLDLTSL